MEDDSINWYSDETLKENYLASISMYKFIERDLMLDFSRLKAPLPATLEKVATHKNLQASQIGKPKPKQNRTCRRESRRAQNRQ